MKAKPSKEGKAKPLTKHEKEGTLNQKRKNTILIDDYTFRISSELCTEFTLDGVNFGCCWSIRRASKYTRNEHNRKVRTWRNEKITLNRYLSLSQTRFDYFIEIASLNDATRTVWGWLRHREKFRTSDNTKFFNQYTRLFRALLFLKCPTIAPNKEYKCISDNQWLGLHSIMHPSCPINLIFIEVWFFNMLKPSIIKPDRLEPVQGLLSNATWDTPQNFNVNGSDILFFLK